MAGTASGIRNKRDDEKSPAWMTEWTFKSWQTEGYDWNGTSITRLMTAVWSRSSFQKNSRISLRGRTASLCVVKDAVLAHLTFSLLPPSGLGSLCPQPFFQMVITMAQPQPLLRVLRWSLKISQTHYLLLCSKENCCCCLISFKRQKRIRRKKGSFLHHVGVEIRK